MTKWMEKNEAMKVGNLPVNFGEIQAKKSMESLNNIIDDILQGDQEDSDDSYQFNESFIKTIKDREKQKSIEITDLNQLFE
ncbi:MAG: hypothetical protein BZ134_00130 [Methanosphaera sp. SHI1033]|nr:MAG: hypothetical protein BZ134_00130 [Methanosphaera sp. SHI1033]